jgi:hypothetical protein
MKISLCAAVFVLVLAPVLVAHHDITLRGCVVPGLDKDTYVMTHVTEVAPASGSAMPAAAHGRRVLFWLSDDKAVKTLAGNMVEVRGDVAHELQESEIELKAGPHEDGGLIVEFEGPGKDVRAPSATVGAAIGTSGLSDGKDIKTFLIKVNVDEAKKVDGACGQ